MLATMRKNSRNVVIYVLFGILIAVFVVSFGPQAGQSESAGCIPTTSYALKVRGHEVSENSWRYAIMAMYSNQATGERARALRARETVMDKLIERELLAQAAEDAGFRLSDSEVNDRIALGDMYILGQPVPGDRIYFTDDVFDYDLLERYVKAVGLPAVAAFVEEQRREYLAQKMRDVLQGAVRVSPEEVLDRWRTDNTRLELEYVKFKPLDYRRSVEVASAEVDAYLAAHDADVKKKYELDKNLYAGGGKWVKLRQILVKRTQPADPGEDGAAAPIAPAPAPAPDPSKAKAEEAANKIEAGTSFADVARALSEDERSAKRGGMTDWRQVAKLDPALAPVVEKLAQGVPSEVVETPAGYYVVQVEATSDTDLTYEQVKQDLAEPMARDDKARTMARADAEAALAMAKAGTPLDEQFEPAVKPAGGGGEDIELPEPELELLDTGDGEAPILLDGSDGQPAVEDQKPATPEEKKPAVEEKQPATPEEKQPATPEEKKPATPEEKKPEKSGMIDGTRRNVHARQGDEKARPVEPPKAVGAKPAAPVAKPVVKADQNKPVVAKPADEKKPAVVKPADKPADKPAVKAAGGNEFRPKLQKSGPVYRDGFKVRNVGESKELAKAVFKEIAVGQLGTKVYEVDEGDIVNDAFVVLRVVERTEPDVAEFDKQKDSLAKNYAFQKYFALLDEWTARRCLEVKPDITITPRYVEYGDTDEKTGLARRSNYQPCTSAAGSQFGPGMIQAGQPIDFGDQP